MSSAEDSTPSPDLDLGLDMDLDFDSAPEASALQAVADSMAAENAHTTTTTHMASSDNHDTSGMDTSEDKHDASSPSPAAEDRGSPTPSQNGKKRPSTSSAAEDPNAPPAKVTKRRAARACVSCRARKVRCDVVEGAPCGNCRWDNVECVVQESRRRKKALLTASTAVAVAEAQLRAKGSEGQHHQLHQQHPHHHALHQHPSLAPATANAPTASRQVQEMSRLRVRDAAMHITRMASELHHLRLEKFLPTTGVTVILPAMIIHLLEMKNPIAQARDRASRGFKQCMRVMEKLREIYAAADYATGFLDAALSKAAIDIGAGAGAQAAAVTQQNLKMANPSFGAQTPPPENAPYMTSSEALFAKPNQVVQATNNTNMVLPQTINAAALDLSASPPSTDKDLESTLGGLTPSASGGSEEPELLDLDFLQGQDDIDWNAMAGTELDMDQWLQFPPEGVNNSDEGLVANVFGEEGMQDAMNWAAAGAGDVKAEMAAAA
ncbi:hypothetical protein BN1723_011556 [Verticillium longisporum]|uniref:Zn(2)-C6 fungal-type domain-containing protein n=1 Tax=Verticillium longisporum TaxID=100787 RepID=A0A0G4L8P0_VERLO|nr:hypothetical protein BN1723_011556 [Verticillium longisporum]